MVLFTHTAFDADSDGKRQLFMACSNECFSNFIYTGAYSGIFFYLLLLPRKKHLKSGAHFRYRVRGSHPPVGVIVRIIGIADIGFDLREKVKNK